MTWNNKTTFFLVLFLSYAFFTAWVYTSGTEPNKALPFGEAEQMGKELWQKNNCISCHQLYGLGGYLGPDLTHVTVDSSKGKTYAAAFIKAGGPTMPNFNFNNQEVNAILAYLEHVSLSANNNNP
jgi:nitric oxide reductase subunit C